MQKRIFWALAARPSGQVRPLLTVPSRTPADRGQPLESKVVLFDKKTITFQSGASEAGFA